MYYIIEHDMDIQQIINTKGKANKYGKAKLFNTAGEAVKWLSRHYKGSSYAVGSSLYGIGSNPFYEIKEATDEEVKRWELTH